MAQDIVPELWAKIESTFDSAVSLDPVIRSCEQKIEKGTATQRDAFFYTKRLGTHASKALKLHLILEDMPDGKIYWNIAERTIKPLIEKVHAMVNDYANRQQTIESKKIKVGIKGVTAEFPESRVNALLNRFTMLEEGGSNG